jgi:hypothetical protein
VSTDEPFGSDPGYHIHTDEPKPKTNGSGSDDPATQAKGSSDGEKQAQYRRGYSSDDPDWSILDDRRGDLPDFPIDTLPAQCELWIKRAAHGAG